MQRCGRNHVYFPESFRCYSTLCSHSVPLDALSLKGPSGSSGSDREGTSICPVKTPTQSRTLVLSLQSRHRALRKRTIEGGGYRSSRQGWLQQPVFPPQPMQREGRGQMDTKSRRARLSGRASFHINSTSSCEKVVPNPRTARYSRAKNGLGRFDAQHVPLHCLTRARSSRRALAGRHLQNL